MCLCFEYMCFPHGTLRVDFLTKCLMYEIVCSVQKQLCYRKQRFCLSYGYMCLRYSNKNLK